MKEASALLCANIMRFCTHIVRKNKIGHVPLFVCANYITAKSSQPGTCVCRRLPLNFRGDATPTADSDNDAEREDGYEN